MCAILSVFEILAPRSNFLIKFAFVSDQGRQRPKFILLCTSSPALEIVFTYNYRCVLPLPVISFKFKALTNQHQLILVVSKSLLKFADMLKGTSVARVILHNKPRKKTVVTECEDRQRKQRKRE